MTALADTPTSLVLSLLDELPLGVVLLDREGRVRLFNRYEERMARRQRSDVLGKDFFGQVAPCMCVRELAGTFERQIGRSPIEKDLRFSFPFPFLPEPREVVVRLRSCTIEDEPHGLMYVEDVGAQRAVEHVRERLGRLLVHDMKNPLSAIVANIGFVEAELSASDDIAEALADCRVAAERLQQMMVKIIDYAQLQTGHVHVDRVVSDVSVLAREAVQGTRAVARTNGVAIELRCPDQCEAWIDRSLVRRTFDNLIDNAIAHSPASTTVVVELLADDEFVTAEVRDQGPGIPEDVRARVFEPYYRGINPHSATNRGLGLSFVQLAVMAHGGSVTVEPADGGGAAFRFTVPRTEAALERVRTIPTSGSKPYGM